MAYNIVLANPQQFSPSANNNPLINGWSFDPITPLNIVHTLGSATPSPIDIATVIKNYKASLDPGVYSNIRIKYSLLQTQVQQPWVAVTGEINTAMPDGYLIDGINSLEVTTTLTLQNLSLYAEGNYDARLVFEVYADSSLTLSQERIEIVNYKINLQVVNPNAIIATPETLLYSFLRDGDYPASQNIDITTQSAWTLKTDKLITISGSGLTDVSTPQETIIQGTGNKTLAVAFAPGLNDVVGSVFAAEILIENGLGYSDSVDVLVNIFETADFIFNPPSLSFVAIQSWAEADPLNFEVFGLGAFTLTAPSWLTLSGNSGTDTGVFTATPFNSSSMQPGLNTGNIVLTSGENTYTLPVTYLIIGTINTVLDEGNFNFTKEPEYLQIYNVNQGIEPETYNQVKILLTINKYKFVSFLEETKELDYDLSFYNFNTEIHIGEIVERLLFKATELTDFGINGIGATNIAVLPVYKPASVDANIQIINRDSEETIFEENLLEMKFVAGTKPDGFLDNNGILTNCTGPKRVTQKSKEILNFLVSGGYFKIESKVNNEEFATILTRATGGNNVFRYFFDFSDYNPGDVVTIRVVSGENNFTQQYILIPEGKQSNHLAFITQYNTLELFECTGEWEFSGDIKRVNQTKYKNLVNVLESLKTTKASEFVISTGHIFKENEQIVDEIVRSQKAWLMLQDNTAIELIPKEKKLIPRSSDQSLYAFSLEFNINRKKDAQNYTL